MRILAVLTEARGVAAGLDAALAAARVDPDSRIEALHVKVDPAHLGVAPEEAALQQLRQAQDGTAEVRASAVRAAFAGWRESASAADRGRVTYGEIVGAEADAIRQAGRDADLLVLTRPGDLDAADALHTAIFELRGLCLLPPSEPSVRVAFERLAIAWAPGGGVERAIRLARPWIAAADRVSLIAIQRDGHDPALAEGEALLRQAGVETVEIVLRAADARARGEQLLALAKEVGAQAMVMGAFKRGAWVEWAVGGTTRRLLEHAPLPLLLAH